MENFNKNIHEVFYNKFHDIKNKSEEIHWFHRIELPNGEITSEVPINDEQYEKIKCVFPDFKDKTVLDVGAWDGFWSFKAESLGASRVLATDHLMWSGPGYANKKGFDYAKEKLGSKVESLDIDTLYARSKVCE